MKSADRLADRAAALHEAGLQRSDAGDMRGARSVLKRSLRLLIRASGAHHPDVANVLVALARLERESGNVVASWRHARRAVRIMSRVRGGGDLPRLRVQALTVFGEAQCARGHYAEARALLRRALIAADRHLGRRDIDTAVVLNAMGIVYKYSGRYDAASRVYGRVRRALRHGRADPQDVATYCHNVAGLEHARGHLRRAELLARRALRLRRRLLPPGHPQIAAEMAALAPILDARGRHAEAVSLLRNAIATFRRAYGPASYDVAVALHNLAATRETAGDIDGAAHLYRRAWLMKKKSLGPSHPDTAITTYSLGLVHAARGDTVAARRLLTRARSTFARRVGRYHPVVADATFALRRLQLPPDQHPPE